MRLQWFFFFFAPLSFESGRAVNSSTQSWGRSDFRRADVNNETNWWKKKSEHGVVQSLGGEANCAPRRRFKCIWQPGGGMLPSRTCLFWKQTLRWLLQLGGTSLSSSYVAVCPMLNSDAENVKIRPRFALLPASFEHKLCAPAPVQ